MANATLPIQVPTVPNGWCPTSWQEALAFFGKSVVILENSGFGFIIISSTAPGATDRDKAWLNTNDNRIYRWKNEIPAWVTAYDNGPENSAERRFYRDTEASLKTYDGGEDATVGAAAGPFWEVDTDMSGKFAVGIGTLPSGASLALDATGGVDTVTLTGPQSGIAAHVHAVTGTPSDSGTTGDKFCKSPISELTTYAGNTQQAGPTDAAQAHTNMPPYVAGLWIKRTGRIYRRAG